MPPISAAFFGDAGQIGRVYAQGRRERVAAVSNLSPHVVNQENFEQHAPQLAELEAIFSTWGMPAFSDDQIARLPNLKAVFYAAGSVQNFARPFLERGIVVLSGWGANAVPVAEFTLAQILLANKGYFRNRHEFTSPDRRPIAFRGRGNFGATVALLGAGQIGCRVIELLRPFELKIVVFDPFLAEADAANLGVKKVSLEAAFAHGDVVTNHLANLPATVGLLNGALFETLPANATFINTGRGATVDEADLLRVLKIRPDVTALLDVTDPEPPSAGSPLYRLPNVHLTTHIAGSINDEAARMAEVILEEFTAWQNGEPLRYAVTLEMLETMA